MITTRKTRCNFIVTLALACFCVACATPLTLQKNLQTVWDKCKEARSKGAYQCAPKQLALAEVHTEMMQYEMHEGDSVRAERHHATALINADEALRLTDPASCTVFDADGDGILDKEDKCPKDPEDFDKFVDEDGCPDPDNDNDKILDINDKCPNVAEDFDNFSDNDGCPEDNDDDGIPDHLDSCPLEAGPVINNGCPQGDKDKDTVLDSKDQCPDVPGKPPTGCPARVLVEIIDNKIALKDKILFATNKTLIKGKISFEILDQIAAVIYSNPSFKIIIEGHTDDRGDDKSNLRLSDGRAKSVREYLVKKGIKEDRLSSVGYGESRPIASNKRESGRSMNRRVEFIIIKPEEVKKN